MMLSVRVERLPAAVWVGLALLAGVPLSPASAQSTGRSRTSPPATPTPAPVVPIRIEEQKGAYLVSGIAKRIQNDLRGAVDDLNIYVSGNERDPDGHWELALAYSLYNEAKPSAYLKAKAVEHFQKCFELSPMFQRTLPPSTKASIVALAQEGRKRAGIAGEPPPYRPVDAEGMLRLAENQLVAGELFEAKKAYDDLRDVPPPPSLPDRERVRARLDQMLRTRISRLQLLEATDIQNAQAEFGMLLKHFPEEPSVLQSYMRLQAKYSRAAMEDVAGQKIYQTFKNNIDGFMFKGQYKDALSDVNRMLFNFPRDEHAERRYEEIVRRNDEAMKAAESAYRDGRLEEARKRFEDLRRDYPDPGTAQDAISEIDDARRKLEAGLARELEKGSWAEVYRLAKDLQAKFPSNARAPEAVKSALSEVKRLVDSGLAAVTAGRYLESIRAFRSALEVVPGHAEAEAGIEKAREAIRQARRALWPPMESIPAGTYVLGSSSEQESKPKNKAATLPAFFLDRYKVSNASYRIFVLSTGAKAPASWKTGEPDPQRLDFAVTGVSYAEAVAYCGWLGKCLPTEPEWEKAARGREGLDLPYENAPGRVRKSYNAFTEYPVGKWPELASPFRVEGLVTPAFEWTSSWFGPYPGGDERSFAGVPKETMRVVRGGSRIPGAPPSDKPLPATHRERRAPDRRDLDLSFRCAAAVADMPAGLAEDKEPERVPDPPTPSTSPTPAPSPAKAGG